MFNDYSNVSKCAEIWALCFKKKIIKRLHIPSALGGGGVAFATGGPVGNDVGFIVGGGPAGVGPVGGGP